MQTQTLKTCRNGFVAAVAISLILAFTQTAMANAEIYEKTLKSTTWIIAKSENGYSTGSGVLVDLEKKWIVTNFHVVGASKEVLVFFPQFAEAELIGERQHYIDGADSFGIRGRVVMSDQKRDLAIVELATVPEGIPAIKLAESSIRRGEWAHSVGNPAASGALWPYSHGKVRSIYRKQFRTQAGEHNMRIVETQSPINPGDSGGPVVNDAGELVAIVQSLDPNARLMSYCVDIKEVKAFIAEVVEQTTIIIPDVIAKSGLNIVPQDKEVFFADLQGDSGATQRVFISANLESYGKAATRKIWALATVSKQALTPDLMAMLLEQSARTKLGAWVIERNTAGEYLIIFCAKIDGETSPESLRNSVEFVSKVAATMKQKITASVNVTETQASRADWFGGQ